MINREQTIMMHIFVYLKKSCRLTLKYNSEINLAKILDRFIRRSAKLAAATIHRAGPSHHECVCVYYATQADLDQLTLART